MAQHEKIFSILMYSLMHCKSSIAIRDGYTELYGRGENFALSELLKSQRLQQDVTSGCFESCASSLHQNEYKGGLNSVFERQGEFGT